MNPNYTNLLREFIKLKSVSTDLQYKSEIGKTAEWLKELFEKNNFKVQFLQEDSNPIVLASIEVNHEFETCLIYGHYDVQPAQIEEGWNSEPFELNEKDGRLYARGIVDNKGQIMIHVFNVLELLKSNELKYNIKFLIEGDEETGSHNLPNILEKNKDLLSCDFVLFSDGELTMGHPSIDVSYRGISNITLKVETSKKDNHSGLYGGSIPNSAREISKLLSKLHDSEGNLLLKDLVNPLDKIEPSVVENDKNIPYDYEEFKKLTGSKLRYKKDTLNFYTQVGVLTSAEITTLKGGYLGEGYRNAIPGSSEAKINFRISPFHSPENILESFENFVKENLPDYCTYSISVSEKIPAIFIDSNNEYTAQAKSILEEVYGKKAFFRYCGAIVPIAGLFKSKLQVPVVSVGLGNEDCNMHGADENFVIETVEKGLEFSKRYFSK